MTPFVLERHVRGSSLIHRLDPRAKVGLALAFILSVAFLPAGAWPAYLLLGALWLAIVLMAELPARLIVARLALTTPFLLSAVPLLVTTPGTARWTLPWGWVITDEGVTRTTSILLRSILSVGMAIVLTATTPTLQLFSSLQALGLPRSMVAIFNLMWRYLFVLVSEAQRLLRARAARSGVLRSTKTNKGRVSGGTLAWRARVTGHLAGSLLIRSLERAERTYDAMCARGYDGTVRTLPLPPLSWRQRLLAVGTALGLMLIPWLATILWK